MLVRCLLLITCDSGRSTATLTAQTPASSPTAPTASLPNPLRLQAERGRRLAGAREQQQRDRDDQCGGEVAEQQDEQARGRVVRQRQVELVEVADSADVLGEDLDRRGDAGQRERRHDEDRSPSRAALRDGVDRRDGVRGEPGIGRGDRQRARCLASRPDRVSVGATSAWVGPNPYAAQRRSAAHVGVGALPTVHTAGTTRPSVQTTASRRSRPRATGCIRESEHLDPGQSVGRRQARGS